MSSDQGESETATGTGSIEHSAAVRRFAEQLQREEIGREVVVVVAGKSGTGKSKLINNLLVLDQSESAPVSRIQPTSVTKDVDEYRRKVNEIPILAIDTPGLHARRHREEEEARIVASLCQLTNGEADILIYCINLKQRLDLIDEMNIKTLNKAFGQNIWKNAIIVFTHADAALEDRDSRESADSEWLNTLCLDFGKELQQILSDVGVNACIQLARSQEALREETTKPLNDKSVYIVGIPVGKMRNNPPDWTKSLLSQIIAICQTNIASKIMQLQGVPWKRLVDTLMQGAESGFFSVGVPIGGTVGCVLGGAIAAYFAPSSIKFGASVGSSIGASVFGVLSATAGAIIKARNTKIVDEIKFYIKVHQQLKQLKEQQ